MATVLGLTGGIASGKSTVAAMLRARGAAVVDADQIARAVVEPGQPALAELVARFGADILTADGTLDRKALGARAFADPEARRDLDRITHPRIAAAAQAAIAAHARAGAPVVFYEAALLIENRLHRGLGGTIVVAVSPEVQAARLAARDRLDPAAIAARLAAQLPLADKLAAATWVVDNSGDPDALAREVAALWRTLEDRFGALATPTVAEHALVTGAPDPLALALAARLVAGDPQLRVTVLTTEASAARVRAALPELDRIALVTGDVAAMDLGLSTAEYRALIATITTIHHVAPLVPTVSAIAPYRKAVVVGTRNAIELATEAPRLRRLIHWSPIDVVGGAIGRVNEGAFVSRPPGATADQRAAYDAEALVIAAMARVPATVLRIGHVVDGGPGVDRTALALFRLVARRASGLQLPLPSDGAGPLHVVRADFVLAAALALTAEPRAAGRVLHLVDPDPPTVRAALDQVSALAGRAPLRGSIPRGLARALLRTPGLDRVATVPTAMLALIACRAQVATVDTTALLADAGVRCPRFADWIEPVLAPILTRAEPPAAAPPLDDTHDPLA